MIGRLGRGSCLESRRLDLQRHALAVGQTEGDHNPYGLIVTDSQVCRKTTFRT